MASGLAAFIFSDRCYKNDSTELAEVDHDHLAAGCTCFTNRIAGPTALWRQECDYQCGITNNEAIPRQELACRIAHWTMLDEMDALFNRPLASHRVGAGRAPADDPAWYAALFHKLGQCVVKQDTIGKFAVSDDTPASISFSRHDQCYRLDSNQYELNS